MELSEPTTGIWTSTSTVLIQTRAERNAAFPFPAAPKIQRYAHAKHLVKTPRRSSSSSWVWLRVWGVSWVGAFLTRRWRSRGKWRKSSPWQIAGLSVFSRSSWLTSNRTSRPRRLVAASTAASEGCWVELSWPSSCFLEHKQRQTCTRVFFVCWPKVTLLH